jgi:tetratricopeptide (TPR) repeat protein
MGPAPGELPLPRATDPVLAMNNLEAQISSTEVELSRAPLSPSWRSQLVAFLITRGDFTGRIADYERAETLAEEGVQRSPARRESYQTRARVRSLFHRFDEALADLAKAESLGTKPDELAPSRSSIFAAQGKLDEALAILEAEPGTPSTGGLASRGFLYLEVGREKDGTDALERARSTIRDVSPFTYASLDYHEAEIRERHGDEKRARQLYARAHKLVPTYAVAAAHLAPYLGAPEAAQMLEELANTADDPEVLSILASTLEKLGRKDEAKRDVKAAAARYDELVAKHEAAFADHAARFWLGPGGDPEKAFTLAQKNLGVRQTSLAFDLALTTALVTKHNAEACDLAKRSLALKHADESLRAVATSAEASRCAKAESR